MAFATMFRKQKVSDVCADCGQPSKPLVPAYNRLTESEVRLCLSCATWHKTDEQIRMGYWSALFPRTERPWH